MARVTKTIEVCDRCAFGTEKPATESREFALEDRYYHLALCERHAEMFDRDLGGWTRLASEVDPPDTRRKSQYFTAERVAESRRINELRDKAARKAATEDFAQRRAAEIEAELAAEAEQEARRRIPGALKWRLSEHARQRMGLREFSIEEVLGAAAQPAVKLRQPWRGADIAVHQVGDCRVIVNDRTHTVITVIDRSAVLETDPPPTHIMERITP